MRALKLLFLLAMLHLGAPAWLAEQGSPDGFMPNAAGTPGQQCVPIPGQTRPQGGTGAQSAPDQPRWTTRWGAIATTRPRLRRHRRRQNQQGQAEQAALEHCASKGGKSCETNITYYNQCVAVVFAHGRGHTDELRQRRDQGTGAVTGHRDVRERHGHELQDLPYRLQLPGAISMTRRR